MQPPLEGFRTWVGLAGTFQNRVRRQKIQFHPTPAAHTRSDFATLALPMPRMAVEMVLTNVADIDHIVRAKMTQQVRDAQLARSALRTVGRKPPFTHGMLSKPFPGPPSVANGHGPALIL